MYLIIGDGLIGSHLNSYLEDAVMTSRKQVDLRYSNWDLPKCEVAFICAGETSTQRCEEHPEETRLVNVTNTIKLAKALQPARIVWISSERVFDGSKSFRKITDTVCPTSEYGKQKAEAETGLLELGATVIRFSKILGNTLLLFQMWARDLRNGMTISPMCNYSMSPLPVSFAVEFMVRLSDRPGLYQVSGLEDYGYEEIARHIASILGVKTSLVMHNFAPYGHSRTTLDDNGITKQLEMSIPSVWETISECTRNSI